MNNVLTFDLEDWFQASNMESVVKFEDWLNCQSRLEEETRKLLGILKSFNVKATFFVLGFNASRFPELISEIEAEGHEIAMHGYAHNLVYGMTEDEFREDIKKAKDILENLVRKPVVGYRAPSYSITDKCLWAFDVLMENGIKYDSSIYPVGFHDRYGIPDFSRKPLEIKEGFYELPLPVIKLFGKNIPVATGSYFRITPYWLTKIAMKKCNSEGIPVVVNVHPWEFDPDIPKVKIPFFYRYRHYNNLSKTEARFKKLIQDFNFVPCIEKLKGMR